MFSPRLVFLSVSSVLFAAASASVAFVPDSRESDLSFPGHTFAPAPDSMDSNPPFPGHAVTPVIDIDEENDLPSLGGGLEQEPPGHGHRMIDLVGVPHQVGVYEREHRVTRVYGKSFSHGESPRESAELFLSRNAHVFDAEFEDFTAIPHLDEQPIMYDRLTDTFKFTGMNYAQVRDGLPVFRSRLVLLVRNEENFPLVLASADVRPLADFRFDGLVALPAPAFAYPVAQAHMPGLDRFEDAQLMIWAGVDDMFVEPRAAWVFIGERGDVVDPDYARWLYVVDAETSELLYAENKILHAAPVQGNAQGNATQGIRADFCAGVAPEPMPYVRAWITGNPSVFADANGDFTIPWAGSSPVTVNVNLQGLYFRVNNEQGQNAGFAQSVTPPGPVNVLFNPSNNELTRAEVNAYLHSNVVRDFVLYYNPQYPTIANQTNFAVNVNINANCNAFYNGSSINFYTSGGACANTAFSTVVYHEYGHHLIAVAGSGQGAYGEGMSDCIAVIVTDDPGLGYGFNAGCGTPLRNADNNCQYSAANCTSNCGSAIHSCGRLLSGCVWDLRNELLASKPSEYRDILSALTINSILLHTGTLIDPSITIDFLTLDDDDDDILNGTPHYPEIQAAFSAHNMPGPQIPEVAITLPQGAPVCVRPDGLTQFTVDVAPLTGQVNPNAVMLFVSTGGSYFGSTLTQISPGTFQGNFPASACLTENRYYVRATTTSGQIVTLPPGAGANPFRAISGFDCQEVFADDFEDDLGWSVVNFGGLTDGEWERGVPIPWTICNRGNPPSDADGSGKAYLTANRSTPNCNSDVDNGTTSLRSPIIDASNGGVISYYRWYSNTQGNNPNVDVFEVFVSSNGGISWVPLEVVGPGGPEADGGWYFKSFNIEDFIPATSQFRVRFDASDLGPQAIVEAAVDGVTFTSYSCTAGCTEDLNGDGVVDSADLLVMLSNWGTCSSPCPSDLDGDGQVNSSDLLILLSSWGPCQ